MNIICMGGRTVGPAVAWDLVRAFLAGEFSGAERHVRRLAKVASLEPHPVGGPSRLQTCVAPRVRRSGSVVDDPQKE